MTALAGLLILVNLWMQWAARRWLAVKEYERELDQWRSGS